MQPQDFEVVVSLLERAEMGVKTFEKGLFMPRMHMRKRTLEVFMLV